MSVAMSFDDDMVKKMLANAQLIFLPQHWQRFLGAMVAVGQIGIMEGFVAKCAPDGSPWAKWSRTTELIKERRAAKGHSKGELMRDTSRLMNSPGRAKGTISNDMATNMPQPGQPPAGDGSYIINEDNAILASAVSYGPPLHFGRAAGEKVWVEIPAYTRKAYTATRKKTGKSYRVAATPIAARTTQFTQGRLPPRPWFAWRSDAGQLGVQILSNMITDLIRTGAPNG